MGTQNLGKALGMILLIPLSFILGAWVLTNPTGAISGLSKLSSIAIAFIALVNPRLGLMLFIPQALYTDEIKRLAVAYGAVSYSTIYEVLLAPILTLTCLNAGYFSGIVFGRIKITKGWLGFYLAIALLSAALFATATGTVPTRAQLVLNTTWYLTLIPLMAAYIGEPEKARAFLRYILIWAVPSALWGIQQYYFGLNQLEIDYARTGLSLTHYSQVFLFEKPRAFGFFGSATGYGCVGILAIVSLVYLRQASSGKILYAILAMIYLWAVYASKQRTIILIIPLAFMTAWCFRSSLRTTGFYILAFLTFGLAIVNSEKLLSSGLDKINRVIASNSEWGNEVLRVSTFSDRLIGWSRLKDPSTYSFFGTARNGEEDISKRLYSDKDYNHDVINKILIYTGVAGLIIFVVAGIGVLHHVHKLVYRVADPLVRKETSGLLSAVLVIVFLSIAAGSILSTNPINFILCAIGGALVVISRGSPNSPLATTRAPAMSRLPEHPRQRSLGAA